MDIAFLGCKILRIIKNILKTLLRHSILIIISILLIKYLISQKKKKGERKRKIKDKNIFNI